MPNTRIGKLLPRYSLLVNSHAEVRLSKCPKCRKATHLRKFALFIHIDESGPKMLGKTYRYCSRCAMVMAQRAELEAALAHGFEPNSTASHGKALFGACTMEKKIWREGLDGEAKPLARMLEHVADFKHQCDCNINLADGIRPLRD